MAQATTSPPTLGFLSIFQEANGFMGGYLVINHWGRPLEFRLTSAVQPNRVQQILYAGTLNSYICADLIGKTLVEKTGVAVQLVLSEREQVLELRQRIAVPVLWMMPPEDARAATAAGLSTCVRPPAPGRSALLCHPRFVEDVPLARELLDRIDPVLDLAEPFLRIREAVGEARKMKMAA